MELLIEEKGMEMLNRYTILPTDMPTNDFPFTIFETEMESISCGSIFGSGSDCSYFNL